MEHQNQENLKQLFERFLTGEQATQAAEEISKGEQILWENPAPEPSEQLLTKIKSTIAETLAERRRRIIFRTYASRVAAVAAAIVIITLVSLAVLQKEPVAQTEKPLITSSVTGTIWDDTNLTIYTAEFENIENQAMASPLNQDIPRAETALVEMEMELININTRFWEG